MSSPTLFDELSAPLQPATPKTVSPLPAHTQSLYRKYRPRSFDSAELVGQTHIVQTLRNAITLNRIAHAYLFCGPRGTGKTTTARILAKAVNCLDPRPELRPCNTCANCEAINTGATTDVIEIDAASNRGIDDIRDLRERVKYAPSQLQTKFYIIDEAHQITGAAANAFLKTLEEPPAHTKFVLATTDPEELLATIVSRCQRFDFRRIGLDAMIGRLRDVAQAESIEIDSEALDVIARHATGSLRDALGLLDQLAVYKVENDQSFSPVTAETVRMLIGVSRNDRVEALVSALADRAADAALTVVNSAVEAGEDARQLNRQLVSYLRLLLHERAHGSRDADAAARALAMRFDLAELAALARRFSEIDFKIRHSSVPQLPLEIALVESILAGGTIHVPAERDAVPDLQAAKGTEPDPPFAATPRTSLRDRIRENGQGISTPSALEPIASVPSSLSATIIEQVTPPALDSSTQINEPLSEGQMGVAHLDELWPRLRQDVKAVNRRIEALLSSVDPVAVHGSQITLASAYEFHRNRLNTDEVRTVVEEALARLLGSPVQINCVLRDAPLVAAVPSMSTTRPEETVGARSISSPPIVNSDAAPETPASVPGLADDARRLQAAKNIFDAEEFHEP
ncbi:MAG: DNA polymerase III subunit gamma/tau [Chloroflexia bacterium]|nr:DNA polymerase III subunit gamma/tau [Chloroflexia bacterium]